MKNIEVGLSTATFWGKYLTEEAFDLMTGMEVKVCEVFLTTYSEYETSFIDLLKTKQNKIRVHSVHSLTTQFEPQLTNPVFRTREDALVYFDKMCYALKTLGAKYYTFHGSSVIKKSQLNINYENLGTHINNLCNRINAFGGQLTYENVHWAIYNKPGFFRKILEYAPQLVACLDIKQAMQSGYDYRDYLEDMGDKLRTVHICDYNDDGLCSIGKGNFDFEELFLRLGDMGYDGPVLIELYSNDYKNIDDVKASVDYCRNIIEKQY